MNNKNIQFESMPSWQMAFPTNLMPCGYQMKAAGAKYICIASRHHDGFSMFGTKQSDYNIVDALRLDVMIKACR